MSNQPYVHLHDCHKQKANNAEQSLCHGRYADLTLPNRFLHGARRLKQPSTLHLALPPMAALANPSDGLNEDDPERVAGGSLIIVQTAFVASTAAGISAASAGLSAARVTVTMHIATET